ncbi:MAG: bifunctional folylpolyglutamate synthase/dihydrofolate synthase [Candidatus Coproplasma sp.]
MQQEIRKYGIQRTVSLLKLCGNPDKKLKIIHIAGTNGKGSTAEYITSVLVAAGKRAGAFTSPQVFCFEEQFRIDGTPLPTERLRKYFDEVKEIAEGVEDSPSPFEIDTATALYAFYKEGCEYAVIECGLGGRDDATNAAAQKEVAVITSISLEHTAELGSTLEEICAAKSGIIRDCPAVVSDYQPQEVKHFFSKFDPVFAGKDLTEEKCDGQGQAFIYKGSRYEIKMLGKAQMYNAATAIEVCKILGIEERYIFQGIKNARLSGRLETEERNGVKYILDGAHNPGAIAELVGVLSDIKGERELVFGCLSDKDVESIASLLSPYFKRAVLFSPQSVRAMAIERIINAFSGKTEYITAENVTEALEKTECKTVVVCGSFTFLKEAREWIRKRR